jgi:carbon monoxide dehydrogenase subunit G
VKFEYSLDIPVENEQVWKIMEDIPLVAGLMPGVDSVEPFEENTYKGILHLRMGPMNFNLAGIIGIEIDRASSKWMIKANAQDPKIGGGVLSTIEITISQVQPTTTHVTVNADIQFSGRMGQLGQAIIRKRADSMVNEFTQNLKDALMKK